MRAVHVCACELHGTMPRTCASVAVRICGKGSGVCWPVDLKGTPCLRSLPCQRRMSFSCQRQCIRALHSAQRSHRCAGVQTQHVSDRASPRWVGGTRVSDLEQHYGCASICSYRFHSLVEACPPFVNIPLAAAGPSHVRDVGDVDGCSGRWSVATTASPSSSTQQYHSPHSENHTTRPAEGSQ